MPIDLCANRLLAVYALPPQIKASPKQADELIRSHPDWRRRNSISFVEFGFNWVPSRDGAPLRIDVELVGGPDRIEPLPARKPAPEGGKEE